MNQTTTDATKAKTAKHLSDSFGLPKYEMPKMEVPAEFREMTDKGVAHARDIYAKAMVASEEAADLLENTYTTVAKGATDYNLKLIEIARTNTRAAFDYARELLGVKSPAEFIGAHTACDRYLEDSGLPYVIVRPEGDWDRPGILESSAEREVRETQDNVVRKLGSAGAA